ncbi:MAG: class I SAM-dependent methyltransferase [Lachnospiraceae bacterium]|nr:class I SAM-dependent methyltransferase [Lachnospiraceae bacterium]
MEKVLVWGTGNIFRKYYDILLNYVKNNEVEIIALINQTKSCEMINGYKVICKEEVINYEYDKIIIMAEGIAKENIWNDINQLMIDNKKIVSIAYLLRNYSGDDYHQNNIPCLEILELIRKTKKEKESIAVAEIGIDIGATSIEVCKLLESTDTFYCFDFEDKIRELLLYLKGLDEVTCDLVGKGNSHKLYDSYCWSLCELLFEMRNHKKLGIFDVVYLDGAHDFFRDGLACCILKELIKPNGFIIFDDICWNYGNSSTCNPKVFPQVKELFTDEQIYDCQIQRVVDAFMLSDERFKQFYIENISYLSRAIFIKES